MIATSLLAMAVSANSTIQKLCGSMNPHGCYNLMAQTEKTMGDSASKACFAHNISKICAHVKNVEAR